MGRMVEIDEETLLAHQNFRKTVDTLLADPVAKLKVQEAVKKVWPNARTPELDAAQASYQLDNAMVTKIQSLEETIKKDRDEREAADKIRQAQATYEAGFDKLRRERGFTDAGIEAVRKLMEERALFDHELAADAWEKRNPTPAPTMPNGRAGFSFFDAPQGDGEKEFVDKLLASKGEDVGLLDKRAFDTLQEIRGAGRR